MKRLLFVIGALLLLASKGVFASAFPYAGSGAFLSPYGESVQAANGERTFVRINRDAVVAAVSTGQLAIPLPSGDVVLARHERDYTNERGDWTFVGKVDTAVGAQAVVITFGTDGVFGVIPSPSGHLLQVQSGAGGRAWVEPIDDLIPPGTERKNFGPGRLGESTTHDHSQCYVIPPTPKAASDRKPLTDEQAEAIAKSGTMVIDVLGIYTSGVVEERGSAAAAETYFHSLVSLANQAFVDSGVDVRYRVVGLRQVPEMVGRFNIQVIEDLRTNRIPGIDVVAEREAVQADLVPLLRRYQAGDPSCGNGFLNGHGLRGSQVVDGLPYSVNACGGYVLAHEFGHNLGLMHDIETTFGTGPGAGDFGAYRFSLGYRQPGRFSTVMAYGAGGPWLGRFSDPQSNTCLGEVCGITDLADNVRSIRLMAPRIAAFRNEGASGLAVSGTSGMAPEGESGPSTATLGIRLSQPAPPGGITVDWETVDGTAIAGWDYLPSSGREVIPAGGNSVAVPVSILGDALVEADERFFVRLRSATGARLATEQVPIVIRDDDPSGQVSGRVLFPSGMTPPTQPFSLSATSSVDGQFINLPSILVSPPEFAYHFAAPLGAILELYASPPFPFAATSLPGIRVSAQTAQDFLLATPRTVSGRLIYPAGNVPTTGQWVQFLSSPPGSTRFPSQSSVRAEPPEFRFSVTVADRSRVQLRSGTPGAPSTARAQRRVLPHVSANVAVDVAMSLTPTVGFSQTPQGRAEGGRECYLFELSAPSAQTVTVPVELISGTGSAPGDARISVSPATSLTFSPGTTFGWICVDFLADSETEPNETVILRLGQPTHATLEPGGHEAELTIIDVPPADPNQPIRITLADVQLAEGHAGSIEAMVPLTFSRPAPQGGLRLRLSTVDGNARAGQDYEAKSLFWDLPPNLSSTVFTVPILGDRLDEADEHLIVRVSEVSSSAPTEIVNGEATITIRNDDATPRLRVLDAEVSEGDSGAQSLVLRVALSHPAASTVMGTWSTGGGTATAGSDYTTASGSFSIPAGQSTATLAVEVLGDTAVESNETFNITVGGVVGAVIDDGTAVVTITNDDVAGSPNLRIGDVSVVEGNSGRTAVVFPVTLSSPAGAAGVAFDVATVSQSAQAGSDFDPLATQRVTIASGVSSASIRVDVLGDTDVEADESFGLSITNVSGATLRTSTPRAIIRNDDARASLPQLVAPADVSVTEGNSGTQAVRLAWTLSSPAPAGGVTFDVATVDGTAKAGEDFVALSTPVRIEAGQTRTEVVAQVNGDTTGELDEAFVVAVANVRGALPDNRDATVRIMNDDARNRVSGRLIADAGVMLPEVVFLSINDQTPSQSRTFEARAPGYQFEVLIAHSSAVDVVVHSSSIPVPGFPDPGAIRFGAVSGEVTADFRIRRGFVARGRVIFPAGASLPSAVWVYSQLTGGGDPLFARATAPMFEFQIILRPGVANCLGAHVHAPLESPCTDLGIVQSDLARDIVVGMIPALQPRPDRAQAAENSASVGIPVLANDVFVDSRLQWISLVSQPNAGTASLDGRGTATPTDDVLRYVPPRNWSGVATMSYRLCESTRCSPAVPVTVHVAPVAAGVLDLSVATNRGFREVTLSGLRALPGVRFQSTPLSAPLVGDLALAVDNTPETPWDNARAGTAHVAGSLAGRSGSALPWQVFAEASGLGGDVDLYLGEDLNGDGQPSESELRCTSAMSTAGERCELAVTVAAGGTGRYWAMLHNRSAASQSGRLHRYEVPLLPSDDSLVTTAPGILAAGQAFPLRVQWDDPTLLSGEARVGYVQMQLNGVTQAVFPVKLTRTANESSTLALVSGVDTTLRLPASGSHEQLFIDVPAGASQLQVTTSSASNVDVYLSRVPAPMAGSSVPSVAMAPPRNLAVASGKTPGGNESVTVVNPAAGRWYVTPVNMTSSAATTVVRATVQASAPVVRPGGYFNTGRSGHGIFLHPAGGEWAGIWFTYLEDRTPTWYYLQGPAPGANGIWRADVYRGTWVGGSGFLTIVGEALVTPTAPDAFTFTYTLDGQVGSEAFSEFGRGCPTIAGAPVNISQHYFDPLRSGSGYTVQVMTTPGPYEFHAMFVYDAMGVPRFLVAENPPVAAPTATLSAEQLLGFCPLCERLGPPTRTRVGTFVRTLEGGRLARVTVDVAFAAGVPGGWRVTDNLIMLDPQNRAQGCQ